MINVNEEQHGKKHHKGGCHNVNATFPEDLELPENPVAVRELTTISEHMSQEEVSQVSPTLSPTIRNKGTRSASEITPGIQIKILSIPFYTLLFF